MDTNNNWSPRSLLSLGQKGAIDTMYLLGGFGGTGGPIMYCASHAFKTNNLIFFYKINS